MSALTRAVLTQPPPTSSATAISQTAIDVTWAAVVGATSYRVYRNGALVETTSALTHSSIGLSAGTLYSYQVSSVGADGQEGPKGSQFSANTFAAPDTTPPTAPVIAVVTTGTTTQTVSLVTPSSDAGSGVAGYTLDRATNTGFTAGLVTIPASFPVSVTNLAPSTLYFYRARSTDVAGNPSAFSLAVSAATQAGQQSGSYWPNWPIMNTVCLQGAFDNTNTALDQKIADHALMIFQGFYPTDTRKATRIAWMQRVRAINPGFKAVPHVMAQETWKVAQSPPNNSELEIAWNIINSATRGRESWYVHRVGQPTSAGRVESNNQSALKNQCNMACLVSGLNSLGRNYAYEFWQEWDTLWGGTTDIRDDLSGAFMDNFNQRPPDMFINNGGTLITDHDFDGNGTIDSRTNFTADGANAGGDMWAKGHMEFKAQHATRFPTKLLLPNRARAGADYTDSAGDPPLPMPLSRFYRQFECTFAERMDLKLGLTPGASSYSFSGGGSVNLFYRCYEIGERELKPDAQNTLTGKGAVLIHANCVNRSVPTSDDFAFARFIAALALLVERGAPCLQQSDSLPLSLDECLLELGAPTVTRTMGTLDESTSLFSLKAADAAHEGQTVGVANFYWARFAKALVVARIDPPTVGAWPSADAAVTCTLPTPPAGKKWQRINAATYVNPITGRAMRGQDTTVNSGADVMTVALKPFHAIFLRLV